MKPIVPLGPRDRGEAVANLQEALLLLIQGRNIVVPAGEINLPEKLKDERTTQRFSDATMRAVALFRDQSRQRFGLEPGEIVDRSTADALNQILQEIGAFDVPQAEWVVRGQVVDASGPLNDIQVTVFDRDLFFRREGVNTAQRLGSEITKNRPANGEDGWFEVAYTTAGFSAGDDAGNGITAPDLVFALNRDGQPLEDFQIFRRADDAHISQETLVSDDDLILGIQARSVEEVRIVIAGGQAKRVTSEYERLIDAIERLLPERAPAGSSVAQREALVGTAVQRFDEETHRDISFLARETGFDPACTWKASCSPEFKQAKAEHFGGPTKIRFFPMVTDAHGLPIIQGDADPKPGYCVSTTALHQLGENVRTPLAQLDSNTVSFAVIPGTRQTSGMPGPRLGDFDAASIERFASPLLDRFGGIERSMANAASVGN